MPFDWLETNKKKEQKKKKHRKIAQIYSRWYEDKTRAHRRNAVVRCEKINSFLFAPFHYLSTHDEMLHLLAEMILMRANERARANKKGMQWRTKIGFVLKKHSAENLDWTSKSDSMGRWTKCKWSFCEAIIAIVKWTIVEFFSLITKNTHTHTGECISDVIELNDDEKELRVRVWKMW